MSLLDKIQAAKEQLNIILSLVEEIEKETKNLQEKVKEQEETITSLK